jgi:hypothetical protein
VGIQVGILAKKVIMVILVRLVILVKKVIQMKKVGLQNMHIIIAHKDEHCRLMIY